METNTHIFICIRKDIRIRMDIRKDKGYYEMKQLKCQKYLN